MQILIPMSGFGERFRKAGYTVPKPLIEVDGKPIIAHVLDLFPGEMDVTFICNEDHLAEPSFRMREILEALCPTGRIVSIAAHRLGPVHAVLQAADLLDPCRPVVVNYCDFTCYWDWADFKSFLIETSCAGCIPAYRGFHPHSLGSTYYAYLQQRDGWVSGIQEKTPYTDTPMDEFASSGTYHFATAALMREAFDAMVEQDLRVGGEFYVSLAYRPLLDRGLPVAVYEIEHFMQWGTPQDLQAYQRWSDAFRLLADPSRSRKAKQHGLVLVPMAGLGSRFSREGYAVPKPLIAVSGRPMVVQATLDLPEAPARRLVLRRDMPGLDQVLPVIAANIPGQDCIVLDAVTDGQARTCLMGLAAAPYDPACMLTIGACDNGMLFDAGAWDDLMASTAWDVIVWGARGHAEAARLPQMFGWIAIDDGLISAISVKTPLGDPKQDPIVVGAFTFRHARDFVAAAERMIARDATVNGEFYVDTCINDALALGLRCVMFEIEHYLGWGTPNDLRCFDYWQSCFHKWSSHPYRLDRDSRVPEEAVAERAACAESYRPARPAPWRLA